MNVGRQQFFFFFKHSTSVGSNHFCEFVNDFYVSGDMLYYKFCQHSVDWKPVDTC